jgi:hypothetical protein
VDSSNATSGAGIVDTYAGLVRGIQNASTTDTAQTAVTIGVGVVGAALDTLRFVFNPLATLISAGLGWLIEHVSFLRAPLDALAGNPDAIHAMAEQLHEVAESLRTAAKDNTSALQADVANWSGTAADAVRAKMAEHTQALDDAGSAVDAAGYVLHTNMAVISAARGLFRDLITSVLGDIIATMLIALAAAVWTFGASIAAGIATSVGFAAATAAEMATKLGQLLAMAGRAAGRVGNLSNIMKGKVEHGSSGGAAPHPPTAVHEPPPVPPRNPNRPEPDPTPAPPPNSPAPSVHEPPTPHGGPAGDVPPPVPPRNPNRPVAEPPNPHGTSASGAESPPAIPPRIPNRPVAQPPNPHGGPTGEVPPPIPPRNPNRPDAEPPNPHGTTASGAEAPPPIPPRNPNRPVAQPPNPHGGPAGDVPPPIPPRNPNRPNPANRPPEPFTNPRPAPQPPVRPNPEGAAPPIPPRNPNRPAPEPAPAPAASGGPWMKAHEGWLKQKYPEAYDRMKYFENQLKDHFPDAYGKYLKPAANFKSAKEWEGWVGKPAFEIIKKMLDIQQNAQRGWAAEQQQQQQPPA